MASSDTRGLLGGRTPRAFVRDYWHKQPLLIRGAIPQFADVLTREELFALAGRDDIQARCVHRIGGRYTVETGPFRMAKLRRMPPRDWTLLVQDVNLFCDAADALLRRFAFLSYARADDVMVSFAAPGGGVGAHFDSYDVFLLQGSGERRWRYGRQQDLSLQPAAPLKLLRRFVPEYEATLSCGDMLYLAPESAHEGTAVSECMTYSIGFRAPSHQEIAEAFVDQVRDTLAIDGRYADPDLRTTSRPARLDRSMQQRLREAIAHVRWTDDDVARFIGRFLTEPKRSVVFEARPRASRRAFVRRSGQAGVRLDRRAQLLYDDGHYYLNGDDGSWGAADAGALRTLADRRALSAEACAALNTQTLDLLFDWYRHGFLATA
jgi:50S ribosomal protein L16 3-hydroxylase